MAFERFFQICLHATILCSFASLAATGQFHVPVMIAAAILLAGAAMRAWTGWLESFRISRLLGGALALLAFILSLVSVFALGEAMYGIVYFFLYLAIFRAWTARLQRDILQLIVLSFFLMVSASVVTASVTFGFMFIGYGLLATLTWIMFSMKRDVEGASKRLAAGYQGLAFGAGAVSDFEKILSQTPVWRREGKPLLSMTAMILLSLFTGTTMLFLTIPRLSAQRFLSGLRGVRPQSLSGFSEQVDFQNLGNIQLDPAIIGRVRTIPASSSVSERPDYLRLRGTSLDEYTGVRWRKSPASRINHWNTSLLDFNFIEAAPKGAKLSQEVWLEPDTSSYLFGVSMPQHFRFDRPFGIIMDPLNFSIQAHAAREHALHYLVDSVAQPPVLDEPAPNSPGNRVLSPILESVQKSRDKISELLQRKPRAKESLEHEDAAPRPRRRVANARPPLSPWLASPMMGGAMGGYRSRSISSSYGESLDLPASVRATFLALPDLPDMKSIRRFAREWAENETSDYRKARVIERRLRTEYQYTTDISISNLEYHMTEFLTSTRRGHCEYFASAMTLMLRALDVPARIVTGYYTDEWNETGGYFIVRRQHAHSWVEAWIRGQGWVTFEPSPSSGMGANRIQPAAFARLRQWLDTLRYLWYRHVIDFDLDDQYRAARSLSDTSLGRGLNIMLTPFSWRGFDFGLGRYIRHQGLNPIRLFFLGLIFVTIFSVAALLAKESLRAVLRRRSKAPGRAVRAVPLIPFYREILKALEGLRFRKAAAQTPLEFARRVIEQRPEWSDLGPVTHAYYRIRYKPDEVRSEELQTAQGLLDRIRKSK